MAALLSVRIEKFTSDLIPIQHAVAGIAEPSDGHGGVVEVFQIALNCLADDVSSAAPKLACSSV